MRVLTETDGSNVRTYAYDDRSNRTNLTATGAEAYTTAYAYDLNNRLLTETRSGVTTTYTYDANGNQLTKSNGTVAENVTNQYNGINQLVSATVGSTTAAYGYAPSGLRTSKTVGGVTTGYVLDGDDVVLELQGTAVTGKYIRGFELIAAEQGGAAKYYLYNGHGDVVQLTDAAGAVTKSYDYDAFGNEISPVASDANPFRYCGEYYDAETGTYYLRARYYDPAIGRFTQQDTYTGDIRNPLTLNYYTYCYSNPLRYVDRTGNVPVDTILDLIGLGLSFQDFVNAPGFATFGFLTLDAVAFLTPYLPGSYAARTVTAGTKILNSADEYVDAGVWAMRHFERGYEIERALGGWGNNFPVIDWAKKTVDENGVDGILESIKSIKSIDITKKTYQNPKALERKISRYMDDLAKFDGTTYGGITWSVKKNTSRTLEIAIPPVEMTAGQAEAFENLLKKANSENIDFIIRIVS